ncbi:MAG TPA: hypothetical protein VGL75_04050 [Acidothermaceae bacterium]|jgi:hypothetical protein
MDTAREATTQSAHLLLEVSRSADGRLEGQIRPDIATGWTRFSGVLELLKAIEDLLDRSDLPRPRN